MSPSHLFEPTYQAIKLRLMTGVWRCGARLEPGRMSAELGVGVSPIRDSLNRLAGERLIEAQSGEGFHVPLIHVQTLRELLDLNQVLLLTAMVRSKPSGLPPIASDGDHATRVARLFHHVARGSGNMELLTQVDNLSDRLNTLRRIEPSVLPQVHGDLDALEAKLAIAAPARDIRTLIRHFHKQRRRMADRLARSLPTI